MLVRQFWLTVAVILLLVGIGLRQPAIAAVGALILLTGGLARLWNRLALERVDYRRTFTQKRAFAGETVDVTFSVVNRKALPLPWLEVRENVPVAMPVEATHVSPSAMSEAVTIAHSTALAWYERLAWRHRFACPTRGYFRFGPVSLEAGDPFGLFESKQERWQYDHIVVLPRLYDLAALGLPARRPFGEERGGSPIFEDPTRMIGVRDYRAGDPLKRIEWKATARRGSLQSRVYEPAASLHLLVALNVTTLEYVWEGYDPVRLERAISLAGSAAQWAHEHRYAVGLLANSSYPGADRAMTIPPGRDPAQLTRILEALAMVSPLTLAPLEDVLDEAARRLPAGATIVTVAGYCSERLGAALQRLAGKGHPLVVMWVADEPPPETLAGLNVHDLAGRIREIEARQQHGEAAAERERRGGDWSRPAGAAGNPSAGPSPAALERGA